MSALMKKHLTKEDITILIKGKELPLKQSVKSLLASIIFELVDDDSLSALDVYGDWLKNPRMRAAKYLKGARNREGLTQPEVCKKIGVQQSNLSKMESGERPIPEHLVKKFAKLYKIKPKMITE